jgi:peptide/nickel transport system permease protein
MLTHLLKRLLAMIPTLLGITFVTFLIINLAPGDPVAAKLGGEGGPSAEGGGDNQDHLADTIKAKKKLLGMVREDYSVHAWRFAGPNAEGGLGEVEADAEIETEGAWMVALAATADGSRLFAGGWGGALVELDPSSRAVLRRFEGHTVEVGALAVSPNGDRLVSGDEGGTRMLWDLSTGAALATEKGSDKVNELIFLPDGQGILMASDASAIQRLDTATLRGAADYVGHSQGVYALALSTDGKTFWSGGADRLLREWTVSEGLVVRQSEAHSQSIHDIARSPDGSRLATAAADRKVRIFDLGTFAPLHDVTEGHYKGALAVAWSADGNTVYSGSSDDTLRAWRAADSVEIGRVATSTGKVTALLDVGGTLWSAAESWEEVPIPIRYLSWLKRIATLDFDRSFRDNQPVIDKIKTALPVTMGLNLTAIAIIYLISIPIGILAAVRRGGTFDNASSLVLFILYSVPNFWLATMLMMAFSSTTNWNILPSVGLVSDNSQDLSYFPYLWDRLTHLVLPLTVMVYAGFASLSRYVRTSLLETIQQDYVRTARAKGLEEWVVVLKHAFRNSLITIITLLGNLLPAMIGGSVIVEYIFTINGMGKLGFDAILSRDYPVIMAITTMSAFLTLAGVLLSDLLYTAVDPRVSHG